MKKLIILTGCSLLLSLLPITAHALTDEERAASEKSAKEFLESLAAKEILNTAEIKLAAAATSISTPGQDSAAELIKIKSALDTAVEQSRNLIRFLRSGLQIHK